MAIVCCCDLSLGTNCELKSEFKSDEYGVLVLKKETKIVKKLKLKIFKNKY